MHLSSEQLIREAVSINHKRKPTRQTRKEYATDLGHFAEYLESAHRRNFYTAKRKHIAMFLDHLGEPGGAVPAQSRLACSWCRDRGYPDGRSDCGWSGSTQKGYLSAIRFLYHHFMMDEDLPDHDPSSGIDCPTVVTVPQWSPTRSEVLKLFDAPGKPRDRLIAHWVFYAPSRRAPFVETRWRDIDLDEGTWRLIGKGKKVDTFDLHPRLLAVFRQYRKWQLKQAAINPKVRQALEDEETAFVLLTRNGKPVLPNQMAKMLKWRGIRAKVALRSTNAKHEAVNGKTSKICPHSLRRAWARFALNDPDHPMAIDVVSEVLRHKDISTTRRHYAHTKPERARQALRDFTL